MNILNPSPQSLKYSTGRPSVYSAAAVAVVNLYVPLGIIVIGLRYPKVSPLFIYSVTISLTEMSDSYNISAPLKNVRIWQLGPETDVYMKFISLDEMTKKFGEPNPEHYRIAYDGQLGTNDLEAIFTRCNTNHPPGYNGHSLSMSDVVELYDSTGSEYYYCDRFGFQQIAFEEGGQTQQMAGI